MNIDVLSQLIVVMFAIIFITLIITIYVSCEMFKRHRECIREALPKYRKHEQELFNRKIYQLFPAAR